MWWLTATAFAAGTCSFYIDGEPVSMLDCAAGGAWTVRCAAPEGSSGKIRLHATIRGLVAEARVPSDVDDEIEVALGGPGGRAGGFVVTQAGGGLLPGQALGPTQWCPMVQPDVQPGSPRAEVALEVGAAIHRQTGFAEEELDGGVTNRVPIYDAGQTYASGKVIVVQREVGTVPVLTGSVSLGPREEPIRGQLQVAGTDGAWRSFGWTGAVIERELESGNVIVLVVDFVRPEIATATGADPVAWLEADLGRWLARDLTSLLGHAAWGRSDFEPSGKALAFAEVARGGRKWRVASDARLEVRLLVEGDRLRAVIAWRAAPWDDAVRKEVESTATSGL